MNEQNNAKGFAKKSLCFKANILCSLTYRWVVLESKHCQNKTILY